MANFNLFLYIKFKFENSKFQEAISVRTVTGNIQKKFGTAKEARQNKGHRAGACEYGIGINFDSWGQV